MTRPPLLRWRVILSPLFMGEAERGRTMRAKDLDVKQLESRFFSRRLDPFRLETTGGFRMTVWRS